jgi:ketosteroid isomerase-like protein
MSQENIEVVRRGYEHWMATGELSSELVHPEVVWDMSTFRGWPEQQTYSGVEGANQFLADWGETWEDWEVDVEQYLDAGEDVVTIVRQRGRSKATGVAVEMHFGQIWTVRDGQQTRLRMYASPEEALETAGLSE